MSTCNTPPHARLRIDTSLLVVLGVGLAAATTAAILPPVKRVAPRRLADTGLYSDFATLTVRADNHAYTPQYPLWSDGATKQRWIQLPPGTSIDASDVDHWKFPIGTKLWKEFSFGARVETRYMERIEDGSWLYATYAWGDAPRHDGRGTELDAVLAPETGVRGACASRNGAPHDIPGIVDCRACHEGSPTAVLGFSALQLSTDRDPLAPHREEPSARALDLTGLESLGLVRGLPRRFAEEAPRVVASTPRERAVLGYLHGNCGGCHNASGPLAGLGLEFDVRLAHAPSPESGALRTTIGVPSRFRGQNTDPAVRIRAGDPASSVLVARMSTRFPAAQMPPIGTHAVDEQSLALITGWIRDDLAERDTSAEVRSRTPLLSRETPVGGDRPNEPH